MLSLNPSPRRERKPKQSPQPPQPWQQRKPLRMPWRPQRWALPDNQKGKEKTGILRKTKRRYTVLFTTKDSARKGRIASTSTPITLRPLRRRRWTSASRPTRKVKAKPKEKTERVLSLPAASQKEEAKITRLSESAMTTR